MASWIKEGYKKLKSITPAPVKKFFAPAVDVVIPVIKNIDTKIDNGVQEIKKVVRDQEKKNQLKKRDGDHNKKVQSDEEIRKELKEKQGIVDRKADQENDAIHELSVKSAGATETVVQMAKDLGNMIKDETVMAFTDQEGLEKIRKERSKNFWANTKQSMKVGWEKEKTKILSGTKNFYDDAQAYLEYKKENQGDSYSYMGFNSQDKKNSHSFMASKFGLVEPTDENIELFNKLSQQTGIMFDTQKMLTIKEMETQHAMADDWKRNQTTLGKFGIDLWGGLAETSARPSF